MSRVRIPSPAPFYLKLIYINVGFEKKLEIVAEMTVLGMAMFLAAFFCFRVILLPATSSSTWDKIDEVQKTLSEK